MVEGLLAGNGDDVGQGECVWPDCGRVGTAVRVEGVYGVVFVECGCELFASAGGGDEGDAHAARLPVGEQRFAVIRRRRGDGRRGGQGGGGGFADGDGLLVAQRVLFYEVMNGSGTGEDENVAVVEDGAVGSAERQNAGRHQRQVQCAAAQGGDARAKGGVVGGIAGVEEGAAAQFIHARVFAGCRAHRRQ